MDPWIHCNKCYILPTTTSNFWFTSCGHILCEGCAEPPDANQKRKRCTVCLIDSGYMQINRKMRPDIMDFFKPPKALLTEYLNRLSTTLAFQSAQRGHLTKYKDEQYKKLLSQVNSQTHSSPVNNSFALASNISIQRSAMGSIIHRPSPTFSARNTNKDILAQYNHSQSSNNSFVPASVAYSQRPSATGPIFHRPSPSFSGKITKAHVLPPYIGFRHRWCK